MENRRLIVWLALPLLGWHWFAPAARKNQQGMRAYDEKNYPRALQLFLEAKGIDPQAPPLRLNTAAALYQLKKYREALDEFGRIDRAAPGLAPAALPYDMGNSQYRLQQYDKALDLYKQALLIDPGDVDAKKNLELTLRKLQEQQKQPQSPPPQKLDQKPDYKPLMQFLNQNERQQLEKRKRRTQAAASTRDW